jgi:hypothetical protein
MSSILFHGYEGALGFCENSSSKHFGDDENDEGSEKASAAKKINQRVTGGGKHG